MTADFLIRKLSSQGVAVTLTEDGSLRIQGPVTKEDLAALREAKPAVVELLRRPDEVDQGVWFKLRELAPFLGRYVTVDGRQVLLWGLSPKGAAVATGSIILGARVEEINTQ